MLNCDRGISERDISTKVDVERVKVLVTKCTGPDTEISGKWCGAIPGRGLPEKGGCQKG